MLGYHVHEKAILLSIVPLAIEAVGSLRCARIHQRLSSIGHISLLPLIFTQDEYILKVNSSGGSALHCLGQSLVVCSITIPVPIES